MKGVTKMPLPSVHPVTKTNNEVRKSIARLLEYSRKNNSPEIQETIKVLIHVQGLLNNHKET